VRSLPASFIMSILLAMLLACGSARAAEEGQRDKPAAAPEKRVAPVIQAVSVDAPPVIDGKLDDACWEKASRLEGFFAPDVDQAPPEETIGLLCVGEEAIYCAIICKDRTPGDIRAQETRRNGEIWEDDFVELCLDPWHQHEDAYHFRVTARGTQHEEIPGGSATKIEWRGDWSAATARTDDGWVCELAIPFSILRYPPGQTTFGLSLSRRFGREKIWVAHPITGRAYDPALACNLEDLHPPYQKPRPIYMPYLVFDLGEAVGSHFDTGLDLQYRMPNGLTSLAALNPDFKQIEDVVESVAFSYTPKYLEDPRPFFVTGQGYLPGGMMLYTRNIEDFDAGVKLFGTIGKNSYGLLDAITLGERNALAARWSHRFDPNREVTLRLVSSLSAYDPDNFAWGLDAHRRWPCEEGEDYLRMEYRGSFTEHGPVGANYEVNGGHFRGSGKLHYDWGMRLTTRGFDPALGYFYDQDSVGANTFVGRWDQYEKGPLEYQGWNAGLSYYPYLSGDGLLHSGLFTERYWGWRNGWLLGTGFSLGREYDQETSDVGLNVMWNRSDIYRRGRIFGQKGVRAGGDYTYYTFSQGFRPMDAFSVNLNLEYSRLTPPSPDAAHTYQAVLTASYDLTPEKCISARLISRDEGASVYAAYRQVVRRGTDIYVILGNPDPNLTGFSPRLAIKLIRVF